MRKIHILFLTCLILCALLSGCGFYLRGQGNQTLPFHSIYIESTPPYTQFSKMLRQSLQELGVRVYFSPPSPLTLQIVSQDFTRTVTSLGNAGQTTTYLLDFTVRFRLLDRCHRILLPLQTVRATRNFSITTNQLNGDLNTQKALYEDMQGDVIQQLLTRLAAPDLRIQCQPLY